MKLISLSLVGYRQFLEKSELRFCQGLTGICGPNGVGKSKLIEAIGFALYGPRGQILPAGDKREYIPSIAVDHPKTEVVLTIEVKGEIYVITRSLSKAEIRIAGTAEPLTVTPTGVTNFVIRLLRLPPDAFVGTFVARQNEVIGLHTLDKKTRVDLVHRLIGISQLQVAIVLADKELEECRQRLRRAEQAIITSASIMEVEIAGYEEALEIAQVQEREILNELAIALEALRLKHAAREDALRRQEQRASKGREIVSLRTSQHQALSNHANAQRDWNNTQNALIRYSEIETELAGLTHAEPLFRHWEAVLECHGLRQYQQQLHLRLVSQLTPAQEELGRLEAANRALVEDVATGSQVISELNAQKTVAHHRLTEAQEKVRSLTEKRARVVDIGAGGICEYCGMPLQETSLQVALETYDQAINQYNKEIDEAHHAELALIAHISERRQELLLIQGKQEEYRNAMNILATIPGQIEEIKRQIGEHEQALSAFNASVQAKAFSQEDYDNARIIRDHRNELLTEHQAVAISAENEQTHRSNLSIVEKWLAQLASEIQILEADIEVLSLSAPLDNEAETAFQTAQEEHSRVQARERAALGNRIQADTRLDGARQGLTRVQAQEATVNSLRNEALIVERTVHLLRQMLTEINDEARPRIAEHMDTWLRSLIGDKFQGVALSEDYRVQADCGAGLRGLDHFSGGEQTLLAVMFRIAISLFCQERAGFDTSFLILDEVFGNQDALHRNQLVQFLQEIQEHYHQVLIVNHIEDVTQMLDTIIEVTPTSLNTSVARMVQH